ncbi:TadE/TadG family type IV pilus assembly protein [Paenibacillus ginsengihumi]|uniref:TadE/TadG family type IV pilus assembly protein n=1 Tax=Paenibacillus ginsengihumi TaxID=431596 RepID=UPI00037974AD|nr:TadE family protein [Paenibacillus ginsengihumi]
MKLRGEDKGSITLEAALVLPLFMSLIMVLVAFVQIALAEMALQSAVSSTAKVVAANLYPVDLLYQQGKEQWSQSRPAAWLNYVTSRVESARQTAIEAETFVDDYSRWIPEPVVKLVAWERTKREALENLGTEAGEAAKRQAEEAMYGAALPVLSSFANPRRLHLEGLKVTDLEFPSFDNKDNAYFGLEAQYEMKLAVPFYRKTIVIKKRAVERAWIGGSS